jgi:hypothetical protein
MLALEMWFRAAKTFREWNPKSSGLVSQSWPARLEYSPPHPSPRSLLPARGQNPTSLVPVEQSFLELPACSRLLRRPTCLRCPARESAPALASPSCPWRVPKRHPSLPTRGIASASTLVAAVNVSLASARNSTLTSVTGSLLCDDLNVFGQCLFTERSTGRLVYFTCERILLPASRQQDGY